MKCLDCEETENLLSDAGLDATADPRHGLVRRHRIILYLLKIAVVGWIGVLG